MRELLLKEGGGVTFSQPREVEGGEQVSNWPIVGVDKDTDIPYSIT